VITGLVIMFAAIPFAIWLGGVVLGLALLLLIIWPSSWLTDRVDAPREFVGLQEAIARELELGPGRGGPSVMS
jgi:hypothetical protein